MTAEPPRPRVFVSSVIKGSESVRRCARETIEHVGGKPVLIEDFDAQDATPRSACLDAVASCDACVIIIGARGGFVAPSGKLVVEEEYDEARRRKIPTFLCLEDAERDEPATALAHKLSGFIEGRLRAKFRTTEELARVLERSLHPMIESILMQQHETTEIHDLLVVCRARDRHVAVVRTVVAPDRKDELDELIAQDSLKTLHMLALDSDLFSIEPSSEHEVGATSLTMTQIDPASSTFRDSAEIHEYGIMVIESSLEGRTRSRGDMARFLDNMVIDAADIERRMCAALLFVGRAYQQFDPFARFARFRYNAMILNYGSKLVERNPRPRPGGISIPMYGQTDGLLAYDEARIISREDLSAPESEVGRAVDRIVRRLNACNTNAPYG